MNPDLANPATDTLDDYEAVRLSDDGPLCWLFVGEAPRRRGTARRERVGKRGAVVTARDVVAAPFLFVGFACIGVGLVCLLGAREAWAWTPWAKR